MRISFENYFIIVFTQTFTGAKPNSFIWGYNEFIELNVSRLSKLFKRSQ
jgi:hypothetical protein